MDLEYRCANTYANQAINTFSESESNFVLILQVLFSNFLAVLCVYQLEENFNWIFFDLFSVYSSIGKASTATLPNQIQRDRK